jgi:hypothetical protein
MPNGSPDSRPSLPAIEIVTVRDGIRFSPALRTPIFISEVWPRRCLGGNCAVTTLTG